MFPKKYQKTNGKMYVLDYKEEDLNQPFQNRHKKELMHEFSLTNL